MAAELRALDIGKSVGKNMASWEQIERSQNVCFEIPFITHGTSMIIYLKPTRYHFTVL